MDYTIADGSELQNHVSLVQQTSEAYGTLLSNGGK